MDKIKRKNIIDNIVKPLTNQGWTFRCSPTRVVKYVYDDRGIKVITAFSNDERLMELEKFMR